MRNLRFDAGLDYCRGRRICQTSDKVLVAARLVTLDALSVIFLQCTNDLLSTKLNLSWIILQAFDMDDLPNDESSDAMAQMMGFSTFSGGSRKKPKHDHTQTVTTQPLPQSKSMWNVNLCV